MSGISRVPTHAVGRANERRAYIRARLSLPLRVQRVAGQRDMKSYTLQTRDISSSGVYFLYPKPLELGTPIDIEVLLVDRPFGAALCACAALRMWFVLMIRASRAGMGWQRFSTILVLFATTTIL